MNYTVLEKIQEFVLKINEVYDTLSDFWGTKEPTIYLCGNRIANTFEGRIYALYAGLKFNGYGVDMIVTGSHIDVYGPETDNCIRKAEGSISKNMVSTAIENKICLNHYRTNSHLQY
jgi:hypothetical protein